MKSEEITTIRKELKEKYNIETDRDLMKQLGIAKPVLPAVLKLTVKRNGFDLIKSGEKTEEYREFKKYWIDRLTEDKSYCQMGNSGYVINDKKYKYVEFKNGYSKNAPTIITECKGIKIGKPTKKGSQLFKDDVFIISLGTLVWSNCR